MNWQLPWLPDANCWRRIALLVSCTLSLLVLSVWIRSYYTDDLLVFRKQLGASRTLATTNQGSVLMAGPSGVERWHWELESCRGRLRVRRFHDRFAPFERYTQAPASRDGWNRSPPLAV